MSLSQTVFNFIVWGILFTTYSMAQAPIVLNFPFPEHGNTQTLRRELHSKGVVSKPVIIPDKAFRDYCLSLIEASGGTEITSDQMAVIKRISISDRGIASLEGIEYCTGLDVGSNLALQYLDCSKNNLETLNVQHNKKLLLLICADNELESLSVAENYALEYLDCANNPQLKELWLKPAQDTTLHTKDVHTRYRWDLPPW